jgi:hypothetical protein
MNQFDKAYITSELEKIGKRVSEPISIYLIGGCAMSLRGLKESTKDIDILFQDKKTYDIFCNALFGAEYHSPYVVKDEHRGLAASAMYENKDGLHLDLFVEKVMEKLELSKSMIARAELFRKYGKLEVYLISKDDIFLFKGLASEGRKRDLSDMEIIYPSVDWDTISRELKSQKLSEELVEHFIRRLEEFHKVYKLDVPPPKKFR